MGGIVEAAEAVAALKSIRRQLVEEIANIDAAVAEASRMLSGKDRPKGPVIAVESIQPGDLRAKVSEVIRSGPRGGGLHLPGEHCRGRVG